MTLFINTCIYIETYKYRLCTHVWSVCISIYFYICSQHFNQDMEHLCHSRALPVALASWVLPLPLSWREWWLSDPSRWPGHAIPSPHSSPLAWVPSGLLILLSLRFLSFGLSMVCSIAGSQLLLSNALSRTLPQVCLLIAMWIIYTCMFLGLKPVKQSCLSLWGCVLVSPVNNC